MSGREEAINKAEELGPDLVLMDILLRENMQGIEAAEQIGIRLNIPVLYLTAAYMDDKTLERARITEPFGYISKPFEENELGSPIEMALSKHNMEREPREWGTVSLPHRKRFRHYVRSGLAGACYCTSVQIV